MVRKQAIFRLSVMLALLASSTLLIMPVRAQTSATDPALDMVGRINAYRDEWGLPPLQVNAALQQMARDQATYLASLPELPADGDYHRRADGTYPRQSALLSPVNWTPYGSNDQISIGENAAVGSASFSMNYWLGSTIHLNAIVNSAYREIGVGAVSHPWGYIYIVVFGGRPNELPVLVNPVTERLYLTNEYYTGGSGDWLRTATQIQLRDAAGQPLTEWIPWRSTLPIPTTTGRTLTVVFDDGTRQLETTVDLDRDLVVLPDTVEMVQRIESEMEATGNQSAPASLLPAATEPATELAANAIVAEPDIRLIYDDQSLTLLNISSESVDISQLMLAGSGQFLPFSAWLTAAPVLLDDFMSGGCLQVWGWNEPFTLFEPSVCTVRVAYITIAESARLWNLGDFTVMQGSTPLATCAVNAGICDVSLPN